MCDQTEVSYLDGDAVWVKMGAIWWPGVVKNLEKDEEGHTILAGFKNKPIAVVQFFDEDNYEFVKNLDHIYHYSCRRKDEFIKKGLDKYRSGAGHMLKFPSDVVKAESLTNGDINIIHDPKFQPEEKQNYNEIFGTGKKKKKKDKDEFSRGSKSRSPGTPVRPITHHRFVQKALHGETDHEVRTRIQPTNSPDSGDAAGFSYRCHMCRFRTSRLNVIVAHQSLLHSAKRGVSWGGSEPAPRRRPAHKARRPKPKKLAFEEEDSSDDEVLELKRRNKSAAGAVPAAKGPVETTKHAEVKQKFTEDLLADWIEDDEEEAGKTHEEPKPETDEVEKIDVDMKDIDDADKKGNEMSCFDFDEEEDGFIGMSNANTYGRKIPRVIPVKDKSDLGLDLEVEELFKKKSESSDDNKEGSTADEKIKVEEKEEKTTKGKGRGRGRKRKSVEAKDVLEEKFLEKKTVVSTLAATRARRPGSRKSYLNEVIEKIEDEDVRLPEVKSSSRRKQDLKGAVDNSREEIVYSEIISMGRTEKVETKTVKKRGKKRSESASEESKLGEEKQVAEQDDLTDQIDSLLAETSVPALPSEQSKQAKQAKEAKQGGLETASLSLDYTPEQPKDSEPEKKKSTSLLLGSLPRSVETEGPLAVIRSPKASSESSCVLLSGGKKVDVKKIVVKSDKDAADEVIKTYTLKPEALPQSLLASGKLKGQTILHQKGGKYVIVTQPPMGRQKVLPGKQAGNKLVILTNQQKLLTAAQPRKVIATPDSSEKLGEGPSTSGVAQHVIKVVPDGKGGIMKKVAISPKKLILQGSKMLVSGAGPVQNVQKSLGGDMRLIENYKGTGKTVLIQGPPPAGSNILLKATATTRSGLTRVLQTPSTTSILSGNKKPKILMRTAAGQSSYVVTPSSVSNTSTFVMKRKDGKFAAQKIIRKVPVRQVTSTSAGVQLVQTKTEGGQKTLILTPGQRGESLIIKPGVEPPKKKIIRLKTKVDFGEGAEQDGPSLPDPAPAVVQTQVMAMPGPIGADGNQTYVLVAMDEHGLVQAMDSPLISYEAPPPGDQFNNNMILINQPATEDSPAYSASQDILAEALANTNVLEGSIGSELEPMMPAILLPPSIPSSVVQETSITLQKPIMTPLEMPSSVAPDTSGLEPPPLPPTPTEEDVLMEEREGELMIAEGQEGKVVEEHEPLELPQEDAKMEEEVAEEVFVGKGEESENRPPEEFMIEDSQDGHGNSSFQSMPLLNDEPDTSDDAQGSEPIENQDFETQRSFTVAEPPSSTNEFTGQEERYEYQDNAREQREFDSSSQDELDVPEMEEKEKEPEMETVAEEGNVVTYEMEPHFADVLLQKRFQEETEVTSTTDEFSSKV